MVNSTSVTAPRSPRRSMTALAAGVGAGCGHSWTWEVRSVNGKGRDLRLRLPDSLPALEAPLRAALTARIARGSVTCGLRLTREGAAPGAPDTARVAAVLDAVAATQAAARARGLDLRPCSAAEILGLRGIGQDNAALSAREAEALCAALLDSFAPVLDAFEEMRRAEGRSLAAILSGQLDGIAALTQEAARAAQARAPAARAGLAAALDRLRGAGAEMDPDRVAQELALLAVKADVTEEIDRLRAHLAAARTLLESEGPVGRKLDFLCQEFNREANTLCSKSQSPELTRTGLDLKHAIDQFREQVQNLE